MNGIGKKTLQEVRKYLINKGDIKKKSIEEVGFPKEKFDVIYADPPWKYNKKLNKKGRDVALHYPVMNLELIKSLPVEKISKDNSILFLWVTFPKMDEGIELIESWGFKYKTLGFNWIKKNKKSDSLFWGLGYYTRSNPEVCLIGTKGSPDIKDNGVHSVIMSKIEKHSKKPQEARHKIERLMGKKTNKIELFAREKVEGWTVWGNEIDKTQEG